MKYLAIKISTLVALLAVAPVTYAASECASITDFAGVAACVVSFVTEALVPFLFAVALVVFTYGIINYVRYADNESRRKEYLQLIIFSLIGLFFMVAVWAFAAMFAHFFGAQGAPNSLIIPQFKGK